MKKLEKFLFKDGALLTEKRLWAIGITIALVLVAWGFMPAIIKVIGI